jgi:hypothetical protein
VGELVEAEAERNGGIRDLVELQIEVLVVDEARDAA